MKRSSDGLRRVPWVSLLTRASFRLSSLNPTGEKTHPWHPVLLGLVLTAAAFAQSPPTVDDLLNLTPPPATQPSEKGAPPTTTDDEGVPIDPELLRKLSGEEPADVFEKAIAEMGQASDRLGKQQDAGLETQRIQEGVLAKLDQVIEAVEAQQQQSSSQQQQQQQQQNGSQQNAQQQQQQSQGQAQQASQSNQGGNAPMGDNSAANPNIEERRVEWGNLPPRLRDELLQGLQEKSSAIYRELTDRYYRGLAERGKE
jgi:hypothetical protein